MTTIPALEPASVRAGNTWQWTRALAQYPAPTWTLTYRAVNADSAFTLTATTEGSAHAVKASPTTTAEIGPGRYDWIAQVSNGEDVFIVDEGSLTVLPDLSEVATHDGRSQARRILEAIDAMIEARATDGDLDVVKTAVGARATEYRLDQLLKLRQHYAAIVAHETRTLTGRGGFIQMQFR